ncbi:hypothetical protein Ocin01_01513 [Orchesella cincta]|uniref:Uncharacterized protein n=1 Tax=Orchesella cincta TaxID=48709 RepID=A0A1D2NIQ9_ORCCI|nr:hypothetical protein Ocin01_01513 [Orchesella cincta]
MVPRVFIELQGIHGDFDDLCLQRDSQNQKKDVKAVSSSYNLGKVLEKVSLTCPWTNFHPT